MKTERINMAVESGSALGLAAITKFGWIKLLTLGAALLGASIMAVFRPPKSRKELFTQGAVALGCSLLFGSTIASIGLHYLPIELTSLEDLLSYNVAINGLVGALSWGAFGGLAHFRDKVQNDPAQAIKDVRSI
jgi:hypothetical protein